jgi:hypothetical protein
MAVIQYIVVMAVTQHIANAIIVEVIVTVVIVIVIICHCYCCYVVVYRSWVLSVVLEIAYVTAPICYFKMDSKQK